MSDVAKIKSNIIRIKLDFIQIKLNIISIKLDFIRILSNIILLISPFPSFYYVTILVISDLERFFIYFQNLLINKNVINLNKCLLVYYKNTIKIHISILDTYIINKICVNIVNNSVSLDVNYNKNYLFVDKKLISPAFLHIFLTEIHL